jgi:hypothetical protein
MAGHLMMLLLQGGGGTTPSQFEIEYLVVAGGGGGGTRSNDEGGGGGGAGGLLAGSTSLSAGLSIPVTVGAAAANSVFGTLTAIAGGVGGNGGSSATNGGNGGSGGGGGATQSGTTDGGTGTSGQGNAGAGGTENTVYGAGAGGGSGSAASSDTPGTGTSSSITGSAQTYAIGGSAGSDATPTASTGSGGHGASLMAGDGFEVSGAGTSDANGTYVPDGTHLGFTKYRRGESNWYIVIFPAQFWAIATFDGDIYTAQYSLNLVPADPDAPTPNAPEGPASVESGDAPAPSFSAAVVAQASTPGASGVVVIAYPDTLPALSSISGLTYDEPSRAGYRVYRFTAGSGTITP